MSVRFRSRFLFLALPLLLSACGGESMRDTLGLNRDAPDEFTVLSRPPLSVPPEFNLRPPHEGGPQDLPADEKARSVVTGKEVAADTAVTSVSTGSTPSPSTSSFLKRAGADAADDSIRTKLGGDAAAPDAKESRTLYDRLVGKSQQDPVVDPKKEAERLRGNKETGKPVTEGDVPVEQEKKPSVLDRIF